ncbi:penicillin-binding protein 1C [Parvularcula marina]|uniref:penicillin-binding protein 1C n=1 Tax=Parvularcula marina TaxID=2292771 RepID=UPI0035111911
MAGLRRYLKWGAASAAALTIGVIALDRFFPPPIERGEQVSTVITDREGRPLRAFPVEDGRWRLAADVDTIDTDYIDALIRIEDKRFYEHPGVDPLAVFRALASAAANREITSGASTITMQTARLLEPRERTLRSKIIESFRALQLEARLSKLEILELYLTLAPYGGNLEGVRSASLAYFGRPPEALTPEEIALLIALPQSPEARRPDRKPGIAKATRNSILTQLAENGVLAATTAEDAGLEEVPATRAAFPGDAWQISDTIHQRMEKSGSFTTTLDWGLQEEAERLVRAAAMTSGENVQAAALIIEIDGRAVRAAVGSAGRDRAGGWLDLTNRRRSPGSTLKPFIYGLAFDDGAAAPGTVINDLPSRFASYSPENFDRTFRGEVTIAAALQHSLNVPAVQVLDEVGAARFLSALTFAGGSPSMPSSADSDVGLAIALGGLGISMRDLGILYAALGDEGEALPLAFTPEEEETNRSAKGYPLMSPESATEILTILKGAPPPPGRMPSKLTTGARHIAFKTGTSYGFRDAWAAGVSGNYAVIVWTGYADGTPRPGVTGRQAAAPLLFDLFDAIRRTLPDETGAEKIKVLPDAPSPLARFTPDNAPPQILFPPDEAEIWADSPTREFVLSARGTGPLQWYADGQPIGLDAGGAPIWQPGGPGFYRLEVVDAAGRSTVTKVRVRGPQG